MKTPACLDAKFDKKRPIDDKSNRQEGQGEKTCCYLNLKSGLFKAENWTH
jgi:hypothetical protein